MELQKLLLVNFKNYKEAEFNFSPKLNFLTGLNGSGKTNILDAIYYLSFCKSYNNVIDSQNVHFEEAFFMIQGFFNLNGNKENITVSMKKKEKKQFLRNKKEYEKLSDHIGLLPAVIISPMDIDLINEGSETRRKFMDAIISQFSKSYLNNLIVYNKILVQRNALLKQYGGRNNQVNKLEFEVWDFQLIDLAKDIYEERKQFIEAFLPYFNFYYAEISGNNESINLVYESHVAVETFSLDFQESLSKDLILQYTSKGIHKDDLEFSLNNFPIKKFGSQGQQKTYLTALKLAQFKFMADKKGFLPIFLLDDIFDKLDEERVSRIIEMAASEKIGQVFITDTHRDRMEELAKKLNCDFKIFEIEKGQIINGKG